MMEVQAYLGRWKGGRRERVVGQLWYALGSFVVV